MDTLTTERLALENACHAGGAGVSEGNRTLGFRPAFLDRETLVVYASRFADGRPAPFHVLDGLPDALVLSRRVNGRVASVKASVVSGFVRGGRFYSREQAARLATRQ